MSTISNNQISPYLVAPMLAWVVTQVIKVVIKGRRGKWDWRNIYRSGSMPSSHAAVAVSLATVVFIKLGVTSPEFGIAAVYASVVMYDAVNVRQAVGEHGIVLKQLLSEYSKLQKSQAKYIRESLGHSPIEVFVGAFVGVAIALLVYVV